jgi:ABC-type transport system involved in multi-copper enzyme maturation permease subunit
MRALIATEWLKIVRRRLNHVTLGIMCGLLVLMYVLLWLATGFVEDAGLGSGEMLGDIRSALFLEETVPFALMLLYAFGLLSGLVVVGANTGAEYTWNTVRTMTGVEARRWRFLAAKLLALATAVIAGLLVGLVVVLVTSAVITLVDGQMDLSFVDADYLEHSAASFGRLLIQLVAYLSLSVLCATIGRSPTAGIALAVGVAFLEGIVSGMMTLAGGWVAEIPQYGLDHNADSLSMQAGGLFGSMAAGGDSPFAGVIDQPDPVQAGVTLLIWAAVFLGAAFWWFQRQDLEYQG